ncbi:hypothetical protein IBTHAUMO2_520001 [Nitrosopumilaceae archaeon]|nr:ATP-binding protein [Nitrosopumilus sp.]MDA7998928.1 ATP-binding protein [Nitrosopumilus sp.]CAI9831999.1 hypothetical protein IBTHAUMO2_520001 [Nitrosopumilaceae archaeon]
MSETISVDITPDKSLIEKLGAVGYTTEEAIAELVDNAIDARIENVVEQVSVSLDFEGRGIEVRDDGQGMDGEGLAGAMTVARGTKSRGQLGQFGIGLKSACSALGETFVVRTSKKGSGMEYSIRYDESEWMSDSSRGWDNMPMEERRLEPGEEWHGTIVSITRPKVALYTNQSSRLRRSFGTRYAAYLENRQVSIRVNRKECVPTAREIAPGSKVNIFLRLSTGRRIRGHVALLKRRSIRGDYGMDLYKHGRLIKPHEKFEILGHPELARVVGRLDMDDVPVNFYKNAFIKESPEYMDVADAFRNNDSVKVFCYESRSKTDVPESAAPVLDYVFEGKEPDGRLPARVRLKPALKALEAARPPGGRPGRRAVQVSMGPSKGPIYSVGSGPGRSVSVNTASPVFRLAGNPLFMAGMVAIEAKLAGKSPEILGFIRERNGMLDGLTERFGKAPKRGRQRKAAEPRLPHGYGIVSELVEMHDLLSDDASVKFQFTALSTLEPYLHNLRGRVVYALYVQPGSAEDVAEMLRSSFGEIVFIENPDSKMLGALSSVPAADKIVAIREYSYIRGGSVAGPEKALADLVTEKHTYGIPLDMKDIRRIYRRMDEDGLVDLAKLRRYARASKKSALVEAMIKGDV